MKFIVVLSLLCMSKTKGNPEGEMFAQKEKILNEIGFVSIPSQQQNFYSLYKAIKRENEPMYITVDPLLHGIHLIYDYSLRYIESNYLYDDLKFILKELKGKFQDLTMVKNIEISSAARTNLAYINVALILLDPETEPDKEVRKEVLEELTLIDKHEGFDTSRVLNVLEDYSQYIPRGHYTRSEKLKNYFKTMMWLGRMPFYISPYDEKMLTHNIFLTRCAILMARTISADAEITSKYNEIYAVTSYMVGKSDDFNFVELLPLIDKHLSDFFADFTNDKKILSLMKDAISVRKPRIFSTYYEDIDTPQEKLLSCKFMSQRFIPDSYIFQNLVYPNVGTRAKPRLFPKGLDVLAVLDNERAKEILFRIYGEDKYENYACMLDSLRKEFSKLTYEDWHQNAYWHWLYIIKTMNGPVPFPQTFKVNQTAYQDKLLVSQQGFWAELRHDTILYAKQSYTAKVTGFLPEIAFNDVKVEPLKGTYREIILFLENFEDTLKYYELLNSEIAEKIESLKDFTSTVIIASEYQEEKKQIPQDKREILYNYGDFLEALYTFSSEFEQSEADTVLPLIADVHTDVNTKQALQVGIGKPLELWIAADEKIYKGAMFSYYEFTQPMDKRLTDEEWQRMKVLPPLEKWISFTAE